MYLSRLFVLLILGIIRTTLSQNFYVAAPDTFRLNSEEMVAVIVEGNKGSVVRVFVQDHPGKIKNISQVTLFLRDGIPKLIPIFLDPAKFPPNFLSAPGFQKLVSLTAHTDRFTKEILIPISTQSGYVFIQTDKPIYTPNQRVHMRIIYLNEEVSPSDKVFQLQIKNPKGIIVEENIFNRKSQRQRKAFVSHIYKFPTYPVLGKWSATILFGHDLKQNSTAYFELEEYVLPTFTVKITTPKFILPSTQTIYIYVDIKHVYGKNVQGVATVRLGIKRESPRTLFFAAIGPKEITEGRFDLKINTNDLKYHKDVGWFPQIEGSRLVVQATVVDHATGNKEIAIDTKAPFLKSPFQISFKRCLQDFKPGLVSVFEADVKYIDGRPAEGIKTKIEATADGKPLNIVQSFAVSDENGKVAFEIQTEIFHETVTITLKTADERYAGNQVVGSFVQRKFQSPNGAYLALARNSPRKLRPSDTFTKTVHFEPANIQDIYYLVVAKGKILAMNKLPPGQFKIQQVKFHVTHDMVPNFRVLVFAHFRNELLADSQNIEVDRVCNPNATVSIYPQFGVNEPGSKGAIFIHGTKETLVGLLGVDEAVYALSKKGLLTEAKVFDKFATHDLGCGPGGGLTVSSVLGNAGITIGTNKYTPTLFHTCVEIKRRKREAAVNIAKTYDGYEHQCCSYGIEHDKFDRSCEQRAKIFGSQLEHPEKLPHCTKVYLDCCIYARKNGITEMKLMKKLFHNLGKIAGEKFDDANFISIEEEELREKHTTVRSDFRETWIFEDFLIGPDGREEHAISLPHSITTWVIHAVSVSKEHGICVAQPKNLVSFKKIFIHLNIPYSVVRNEHVEIPATVFNYGEKKLYAVVYMFGAKHLCSGMRPGEKSESKRLVIEAHSANTVTFVVIPLKAGNFPIKVIALSADGSDIIEKKLHVVPEGVTKEINIPIKLDPSNQQRRASLFVNTKTYTDTLDPVRNIQVTAINLSVPEGFVPGTASSSISVIGDQFGLAIETTINNPDELLIQPQGCGEQNMMYLAPTMYTMRYLKASGKLTPDREKKGYEFIRHGYGNQLAFRKEDGSYAAYQRTPTSTWLTAFVMKVFCQAKELVYIDENVLSSGVDWLIENQQEDGSYIENHPMYEVEMMGGVNGKAPMTAFTLIALEECNCDKENLRVAKKRAVSYLEEHLADVNSPLPAAIIAYSLALSGSKLKDFANDKLISMSKTNSGTNTMFWTTPNSAQNIETAGYALLTQLLHNNIDKSTSIVNWLNTKQLQSGSFKSTQDTIVGLHALSQYAIHKQQPIINLVCNISSSSDKTLHKVLTIHEGNALVLQKIKLDKIGGTLFIHTAGHGVGSLAVNLRYNMILPPEKISKFDVSVSFTGDQIKVREDPVLKKNKRKQIPRKLSQLKKPESDLIEGAAKSLEEEEKVSVLNNNPKNRPPIHMSTRHPMVEFVARMRVKRQNEQDNSKGKYKITICVRYLRIKDAGMSIVDVGVFSGFEPITEELKELEEDPNHLIQKYEKSTRGIVFYLQRVPSKIKYCFAFHVTREFKVGNTQMSVIKVYDYYNPDEVTTKLYSPMNNSTILLTVCEGGVCECAEAVCPPNNPFEEIAGMEPRQQREKLRDIACEKFDYVWKGRLAGPERRAGEFLNISFTVEEVIKEGIEKRKIVEGDTRTLLIHNNCDSFHEDQTYLLMGKDGQKYKNSNGLTWYRYLLDKTSEVYMWVAVQEARDKNLQRALNDIMNDLMQTGCLA